MAAPNLVNVTSILGKLYVANLGTTLTTQLVANGNNSDKLLKINSIIVANVDGSNAVDVDVALDLASDSRFYLAKTVTVPADSTLIVLGKDAPIYLEENDRIQAHASAASDLEIIISYEELDDA